MVNTDYKIREEAAKDMPRHLDFTNNVFKELTSFDVEQQVEILYSLYKMLEGSYETELQFALKAVEDLKQKIDILKKINPKN